ncbi:hypothetical protein DFJ77DRAFT_479649 [Powellomyces hirtus]|nr:hypothetical protein DFJ77DRAFT_479649 [Powellomyces hirtus]
MIFLCTPVSGRKSTTMKTTTFFAAKMKAFTSFQVLWTLLSSICHESTSSTNSTDIILRDPNLMYRVPFVPSKTARPQKNDTFTPEALDLEREQTLMVLDQCLDANEVAQLVYATDIAGFGSPKNKFGDVVANTRIRSDTGVNLIMTDVATHLFSRLERFFPYHPVVYHLFLNPNLRFAKYGLNGKFRAHRDTPFKWPWINHTVSEFTLLIYLSDVPEGGATRLMNVDAWKKIEIEPVKGRCVIFSHDIMHSAMPVLRGEKRTMRTDVLVEDWYQNLCRGCLD